MRPLRLMMRAFGPYPGEQVLDFGELRGRSFFLIHGPTGSGKTTVLDAMCYALYGETSDGTGQEAREGRQMRSHHASPGEPTEVTLDFSLGPRRFRVTRRPEWERPRRKGEGTTRVPPEATLWAITDPTGAGGPERVIAVQPRAVTEAVETLLGFRSDQFLQVIVLPQGRFRKLLTATSGERQDILQVLFGTAYYRRVEEALKERARELKEKVEGVLGRRRLILENAGSGSEAEVAGRGEALATRLQEAEKNLAGLREELGRARTLLDEGRRTRQKLQELSEARAERGALEGRAEEFDLRRGDLARARAATALVAAYESAAARSREKARAEADRTAAEAAGREARSRRERAAGALRREEEREPEREAALADLRRIESLQGEVADLAHRRGELAGAKAAAGEASAALETLEAEASELDAERQKTEEEIRSAEVAAARLDELDARASALRQALERRREASQLEAERAAKKTERDRLALTETAAEAALVAARTGLSELEETWRAARAAVLARDLVPGRACPVCGSTEHPAPAAGEVGAPGDDLVAAKGEEVRALEDRLERVRKDLLERVRRVDQLTGRLEGLSAGLAEIGTSGEDDLAALLAGVEEERRGAAQAAAGRENLREKREKAESRLSAITGAGGELGLARVAVSEVERRVERARTLLEAKEKIIPEDLREDGALARAGDEASNRATTLREALETVRKAYAAAEKDEAAAEAALEAARMALQRAAEALEAEREALEDGLRRAGFSGTEEFERALRRPDEVKALEREIGEYEAGLAAARRRFDAAAREAVGLQAPDLVALEAGAERVAVALEELNQAVGRLKAERGQVEGWLTELGKAAGEAEALERLYGVAGGLAETAAGKGRNTLGVSFERYVLGALLDDVLVAASARLRLMSRSRYQLQRSLTRTDRRQAGGLDLEVHDAYTGTSRPVTTLSGGESFLASLSLALGLADTVESYAGGLRLETVFVDEGFGSLDPESLDLALRALVDLQQGGRLVGIISHVPELRERIDARLEVSRHIGGSTARFVVG